MKTFSTSLLFLASASSVLGHATWQQLWVDGVDQAKTCVRDPPSNSPVSDVTSKDIVCNAGTAGVAGICAVTGSVSFQRPSSNLDTSFRFRNMLLTWFGLNSWRRSHSRNAPTQHPRLLRGSHRRCPPRPRHNLHVQSRRRHHRRRNNWYMVQSRRRRLRCRNWQVG